MLNHLRLTALLLCIALLTACDAPVDNSSLIADACKNLRNTGSDQTENREQIINSVRSKIGGEPYAPSFGQVDSISRAIRWNTCDLLIANPDEVYGENMIRSSGYGAALMMVNQNQNFEEIGYELLTDDGLYLVEIWQSDGASKVFDYGSVFSGKVGGIWIDRSPYQGPYIAVIDDKTPESMRGMFEGVYIDGLPHGTQKFWHSNGQLWTEETYAHGVLNGQSRAWHDNGQLALDANYAEGELVGVASEWDADGTPLD